MKNAVVIFFFLFFVALAGDQARYQVAEKLVPRGA